MRLPLAAKYSLDDLSAAEIREAQADDAERVGDAALVALLVLRIEVVADRDLVIEQRDVLVQRLVVELLLVERPAELVQGQLVVVGAAPQSDDRPSTRSRRRDISCA